MSHQHTTLACFLRFHLTVLETPTDPLFEPRVEVTVGPQGVHIGIHVSVAQRIDGIFPCTQGGGLSDTLKDQATWK